MKKVDYFRQICENFIFDLIEGPYVYVSFDQRYCILVFTFKNFNGKSKHIKDLMQYNAMFLKVKKYIGRKRCNYALGNKEAAWKAMLLEGSKIILLR